MRENLRWAVLSYSLYNNDIQIARFTRTNCFSSLSDYEGDYNKMIISDTLCKVTKDYHDFYLHYIADMLKLENVVITENSIEFKAYPETYKNMLVGSLVRFLFENLGNIPLNCIDIQIKFLDDLKNGKSKYRNKLKRFCDFYSRIKKPKWFQTGHSWDPSQTKIKSTQDWLKYKTTKYDPVNTFFTT